MEVHFPIHQPFPGWNRHLRTGSWCLNIDLSLSFWSVPNVRIYRHTYPFLRPYTARSMERSQSLNMS